ncbi:hypothetical protein DL93DRAFT_722840 [Clavulina sp. PMI_390]|nr:hypothetical protein DL93DRAFT_722840 [Clavulina sp. PMI_390]
MVSYTEVPNEVWLCVFENLSDFQTLRGVATVCRRFSQLVTKALYCAPVLPVGDDIQNPYRWLDTVDVGAERNTGLLCLIRTTLARPDLARSIRSLALQPQYEIVESDQLGETYSAADEHALFDSIYSEGEAESALGLIPSAQLEAVREVHRASKGKDIADAFALSLGGRGWAILLLHLVERLEFLILRDLNMLSTIALTCLEPCFNRPLPGGLMNLQVLHLAWRDLEYLGFRANSVIPFMSLPNLKTLIVWRFSQVGVNLTDETDDADPLVKIAKQAYEKDPAQFPTTTSPYGQELTRPILAEASQNPVGFLMPPKSSPVSELILEEGGLSHNLLADLLLLPSRLQSFTYELGNGLVATEDLEIFQPAPLIEALCYTGHANTLTKLTLAFAQGVQYPWPNIDPQDPDVRLIQSMKGLHVLQELWIPPEFFIPPDHVNPAITGAESKSDDNVDEASTPLVGLLPPSLITLQLDITETSTRWTTMALLYELHIPKALPYISATLSNLRRVTIHAQSKSGETAHVLQSGCPSGVFFAKTGGAADVEEGEFDFRWAAIDAETATPKVEVRAVLHSDVPCRCWSVSAYRRHLEAAGRWDPTTVEIRHAPW